MQTKHHQDGSELELVCLWTIILLTDIGEKDILTKINKTSPKIQSIEYLQSTSDKKLK